MSLLEVTGLVAGYGPVTVLRGLDLFVDEGEIVVVLGANGAGKTTTLRAISGMIDTQGSVRLAGDEIVGHDPADIVRRGIAHVPQGRGTFPELSVEDNLRAGAFTRRDREVEADIASWFDVYPVLRERHDQPAGSLSGGEQQMLAVARALMSRPRLLLLDEPSLGLAPLIVADLFERFVTLNRDSGTTLLLVEQNAQLALGIANRAYVLEAGTIAVSGSAADLRNDDSIRRAYLGIEIDTDAPVGEA
jgi:branched-chain amino acid transport system ATP-binding protein